MSFEKEKKINRLILHAARVHETYKDPYLKVPIELCQFAITQKKVREAQIYLAALMHFSGKARQPNHL